MALLSARTADTEARAARKIDYPGLKFSATPADNKHMSTHLLPDWTARLAALDLPVLRASAEAVAACTARPDDIDAHRLAEIAGLDPLLSLRVLVAAARRQQARGGTPVETVLAALVLTGVDPFLREFAGAPVLEEVLDAVPGALLAARAVLARSHAAARIAAAFAIHRQDEDVEEVQLAALLHESVALLLWYAAPTQARQLLAGAEEALAPLGDALMARWGLPEILRRLAYERDAAAGAAHGGAGGAPGTPPGGGLVRRGAARRLRRCGGTAHAGTACGSRAGAACGAVAAGGDLRTTGRTGSSW